MNKKEQRYRRIELEKERAGKPRVKGPRRIRRAILKSAMKHAGMSRVNKRMAKRFGNEQGAVIIRSFYASFTAKRNMRPISK